MREDKSRIGFDLPSSLKEEILSYTVPGTLSEIARVLFVAFLKLVRTVGIKEALSAVHAKKIIIKIEKR